jgi:RimJ/RimL family protein N-acetyltransferase
MAESLPSLIIRLADSTSDELDRFAAMLTAVEGRPITADTMRSWDAGKIDDDIHLRYAAWLNGAIIGFGEIEKDAVTQHPNFRVWLTIDVAHRRQGYGRQFYDFLAQQTRELGAAELSSECKDDDPASLAFAKTRGFEIRRHAFESQLDLKTFDPNSLRAIVDGVKAQGIRFTSLAAEGNTEAAQRKLFELNRATARDNPSSDGRTRDTFENFKAKIVGAGWFRADGQILAVDGDRFVALSAIGFEADGITAFNAFTGVDKEYRGRKIGQAARILAIQYAQEQGAQVIVTDNDSQNAAMLAMNDKFGYVRQPGVYSLIHRAPYATD